MFKTKAQKKGFTLIELIIVVAIIAIIVAAVFVAMDPVKRLNTSRNATRRTNATAVAQALQLYVTDKITEGSAESLANWGDVYTIKNNTANWYQLGTAASGCNVACTGGTSITPQAACVDLTQELVPTYLAKIPFESVATTTRYAVNFSNGAFNVKACDPQGEGAGGGAPIPDITISR